MTARPDDPIEPEPSEPIPLGRVLHKSRKVKETIAKAADDLTTVNEVLQQAEGAPAKAQEVREAIDQNAEVEAKVAKAASELTEVNAELAREVAARSELSAELETVKQTLEEVRDHLSEVEVREAEARRLALHDPLTGLANRALFEENLEQGMALTRRHDWGLAVLFIDIDKFKGINDGHGHDVGDTVLRRVASCLQDHVREGDTVSRWGGDEFTCLLLEITSEEHVTRIAEKMVTRLAEECEFGGVVLTIEASIGIALYPQDGDTAEALLKHADQAMYDAKQAGRSIMLFRECCGQ